MDQPLRFAIVGTPNVGKSSVISTLAEDDKVPVSPIPGETKVCRTYPITIDGQTLIEFIDTPGFMHPQSTLNWLQEHPGDEAISFFRAEHSELKAFHDDNELLRPIAEGAGVIYVVDGSCPISDGNKAEMEILRLSGAPRLAIINSKEDDRQFLEKWKITLHQHFNATWEFNAHHACFAERIALLEALRFHQEWKPAIDQAVNALKADWDERLRKTTDLICDLLEEALCHEDKIDCNETNREEKEKELHDRFCKKVIEIEDGFHEKIRSLFKHNLFKYEPLPDSEFRRNLFSEEVWQVLGLNHTQLIQAAALLGAGIGAGVGTVSGTPVGTAIGSAIGAAIGAASAHFGGESIARKLRPSGVGKFLWPSVGRTQLKIGPLYDLQFFFVLLDRVLIFLPYVINWAHGRREPPPSNTLAATYESYTTQWPDEWRKHAIKYFTELKHNKKRAWGANKEDVDKFQKTLMEMLEKLSNAQGNDIFSIYTPAPGTSLPKATAPKAPASEAPVSETSSQEINVSEAAVSEVPAAEGSSQEAIAPETFASEALVLEASSSKTTASEASPQETTAPETFTSEVPVSENPSAETAASETPASEAPGPKMSAETSTPETTDSESDNSKGRWWSWDHLTSTLKTIYTEKSKDK
ncbi:MAG: DUF3482 domain-containing protein [Deltaproteobacteria bacterium]|nr:DUF3482 domain-containing protein [Deltaproteobacteria bacterium]